MIKKAPLAKKKTLTGVIQVTRKGTGYMPFEGKEDIEIETRALNGALNGDTVEVKLQALFPRPKGSVVSILSRGKNEFVATLKELPPESARAGRTGTAGRIVGIADDVKFYRPIILSNIQGCAPNEKVLVRLLSFSGTEDPRGEILKKLGKAGEHRVEMNAIVLERGFRTEFPASVAREAKEIEKNHAHSIEEESKTRADFRNKITFTIDPADAKDFDDALSIEVLPNNEFEIGVHIADATHFVRPGTALDDEAKKRGTSVYLVDATIPMLPMELSGNVCSLKADEDRLAFSAIFKMNAAGRILDRTFTKSIIRSKKRFSYEEAQNVLDANSGTFSKELLELRTLSRLLKTQREKEGAIDFGDTEVRFILDGNGKPTGVVRKERLETMSLIEEFMLLANREVAARVSALAKKVPEKNLAFLYRIHDEPKEDRISELATFVHAIGYEFGKKKKHSARDVANLLEEIRGKPEEHLIRTATLRSMAKAIYSTKNIGHFGLAFEYYTHFTSPIRRYPDMVVHRILASHIDGRPMSRREFGDLEKICINASEAEARAVDAERESIRYKQVEYLSGKIGQEFDGVVSGVTDWGLYVEEKESAAEGLIRVRTLGDDFYNYSAKEYALIGQRTKKKYALGDRVRVRLVAADVAARTLDFELVR